MLTILIIAAVNLAVGLLIGWSGIAGFLLPMFFVGYLQLPVAAALTLSFFDFALSGAIGSWNYHKKGDLDVRLSLILGAGSLVGALLGVWLNLLISQQSAKLLLYVVVLLSGVSILLRRDGGGKKDMAEAASSPGLLSRPAFVVAMGLVTGAICSLSGAGGPILVMPLLVVLGVGVRTAVGVALFDSLFIAVPAFLGYVAQTDFRQLLPLLALCGVSHSVGILLGSRSAHIIRQRPLKMGVALFSIAIAVYMIAAM